MLESVRKVKFHKRFKFSLQVLLLRTGMKFQRDTEWNSSQFCKDQHSTASWKVLYLKIQGLPNGRNSFLSNAAVFFSGEVTVETNTPIKAAWGTSSSAATVDWRISSRRGTRQHCPELRASMRFDLQASRFGVQVGCQSLCLDRMMGRILVLKCIFSHNLSASLKTFTDSSCPFLPSGSAFIPWQKAHSFVLKNAIVFLSEMLWTLSYAAGVSVWFSCTLLCERLLERRISTLNSGDKENEEELLHSKTILATFLFTALLTISVK